MTAFAPPIFEFKADAQGLVAGVASSFNGIDSYGDTVVPGAFTNTLLEHKLAGTMPVMLWAHRASEPIGKWTHAIEAPRGLVVHGQLNLKTDRGAQAFEHLRGGDLSGLSVGYDVPRDGSEMRGPVRVLKALRLHEVSVVSLPADSGARITSVKERGQLATLDPDDLPTTRRELERMLIGLGFTKQRATALASKGWQVDADPDDEIPVADLRALATALTAFQRNLRGKAS